MESLAVSHDVAKTNANNKRSIDKFESVFPLFLSFSLGPSVLLLKCFAPSYRRRLINKMRENFVLHSEFVFAVPAQHAILMATMNVQNVS